MTIKETFLPTNTYTNAWSQGLQHFCM